jgi:citrate lyase subunit beta/citryl-CoA lyase/(S)-citramalyl-CoA lyase
MDVSFLFTSILKFKRELDDPGYGSDVVVLDLEDAIHVSAKAEARKTLAELDLRELVERGRRFAVRVNAVPSIDGIRDLDALYTGCEKGRLPIDYLNVPKVSSGEDLVFCRSVIQALSSRIKLLPLVETPDGLNNVEDIARFSDAMMFGQADMTNAMYRPNEAYLRYARGRFCVACAREGIPAVDTMGFENISDMAVFEKVCLEAKEEGFTSKSIIHPRQVPVVNKVFAVPREEIEKYRSIVTRYEENRDGFAIMDGQVIAPPFVARAQMMLRLYGAASSERGRRRS